MFPILAGFRIQMGFYPDPDPVPTLEKEPDSDPTFEKEPDPDPYFEKKTAPI